MGKHRKHRSKYSKNYDEVSAGNGLNVNNLSSILGNIDINQIASLLNTTGILDNFAGNQGNQDVSDTAQREINADGVNGIDFLKLINQASNLNNMIMNNEENIDEKDRNEHDKENKRREIEENYVEGSPTGTDDAVVMLLNAIKPMVNIEKAQILDKIIDLYIQGKI
ncbi:hypothetical protein [Clostridium sp.]|jgi:hypothetical protein|uniref:hypothetical protein n=1 Tax=Clostridium sp. TaxID=1506 RepID=UPI0039F4974B